MPILKPFQEVSPQIVDEILTPEIVADEKSKGKESKRDRIAAIYAKEGLTIEAIARKSAAIFQYGEDQHLAVKIMERVLSLNGAGEEENAQRTVPHITISFGEQVPQYSHKLMEVLIPNE